MVGKEEFGIFVGGGRLLFLFLGWLDGGLASVFQVGLVGRFVDVVIFALFFVVLVFLLAGLIYRYALPAMVEVAILVTPPVVPQWLSAGTLASLDQTMLAPSKLSAAEQKTIRDGFEKIASFSTRGTATLTTGTPHGCRVNRLGESTTFTSIRPCPAPRGSA